MLDDFTRDQIKNLSKNDPACIKTLIHTVQASKHLLESAVNRSIALKEYIGSSATQVSELLKNDFYTKNRAYELEQKKIISGLIRQKFVNTVINIPNKTTKSIIEWYLMIPSDTFLKYVEWYKENGYSF